MISEVSCDWLSRWSTYSPDKMAFLDIEEEKSYTYRQSFYVAHAMATMLKNRGVTAGDRVAVLAPNCIETVFLFFALQRLGAILVPLNFRLAASEIDYVLKDSGAKLLFVHDTLQAKADELTVEISQSTFTSLSLLLEPSETLEMVPFVGEMDTPCMILYTSGTTGRPKGVVLTHKILFWNSLNTCISLNLTSDDVTINFSPFFHTGGWNVLLTPFVHRGGTVILLSKFDGSKVLELCEKQKVTIFFGVPTTLNMMAQTEQFSQTDLSSVRYVIVGGEPMPLDLIQTWKDKGVAIRQGFGLTECGPNCFSLSEKDAIAKMGSIGRPNFYVETRIVDQQNNDVGVGEVGELLLRGPMCMTEYWMNPTATQDALKNGWLHTGDLVRKDQDNYFYVVGRKKEMFISGGENVYPVEIERVMSQHPQILEVAVLGVQDTQWGEVGKAFVVTKKGGQVSEDELLSYCQNHLARYKIPKSISFLDELPKGDSGKILKKTLAKLELGAAQ